MQSNRSHLVGVEGGIVGALFLRLEHLLHPRGALAQRRWLHRASPECYLLGSFLFDVADQVLISGYLVLDNLQYALMVDACARLVGRWMFLLLSGHLHDNGWRSLLVLRGPHVEAVPEVVAAQFLILMMRIRHRRE